MADNSNQHIECHLRPLPGTRSAERGLLWEAELRGEAAASGVKIQGRAGLINKLCRALREMGIEDQPLLVFDERGRLAMTYRSIHKAAGRDVEETPSRYIRSVIYRPFEIMPKAA